MLHIPICLTQLSIVSCPPYPGNSRDLAGALPRDLQNMWPRRPGSYPGLMRGDISVKRAGSLLLQDVRICQDSDQRHQGLWGGDLPRDLQEKCSLQSWEIPRSVPWTSQSTKLNLQASPPYPRGSAGSGLQLIAALICEYYPNLVESKILITK